ncbi:IS66 family insertion sequence element accessory protein TnpA [Sphingobacterium sp.]
MQEKRAVMLSMISGWRASGKSKKTYCAENGINETTFYYWFSRSKGEETASGSFIAIDKISSKHEVEVIYPTGACIKVAHDLALVSQLIQL